MTVTESMIKIVMNKKNNGFTLVELLVVIAIISVLTIVTVSQFTTAKKRASDTQRKAELSSLSKALLAYYNDQGVFPEWNPTASDIGGSLRWGGELTTPAGDYSYMKKVPQENLVSGTQPSYCYVLDASKKKFGLFAQLEVTTDSDCKTPTYVHCAGKRYCYSVVSPNIVATDLNGTNP
jgi:prepilin-type N-terminal cleavage/methylation domain-containing protein